MRPTETKKRKGMMPKYKVEMIVEVIEGHPRKWIADTVQMALEDGEDVLEWNVEEIEDAG